MNIIDQLSRGNQELFHSAFIAWLLDKYGSHGLGSIFINEFLSLLPEEISNICSNEMILRREYNSGSSRFDIFLTPSNPDSHSIFKGVVIENKVKSFGSQLQLDTYKAQQYAVVVLAFIPETIDKVARENYPVVTYSDIREILSKLKLDPNNHYHFIISEYCSYLTSIIGSFDAIRDYSLNKISKESFINLIRKETSEQNFRDNDIRTYSYYYYHILADHLLEYEPDLVFGKKNYNEAKISGESTKWHYEKNMQGPPFMEAIMRIYKTSFWSLQSRLLTLNTNDFVILAPRIEVWFDLGKLINNDTSNPIMGHIMLGTWDKELKNTFRNVEPYVSTLNRRPKAKRNFHIQPITLEDLPFDKIAQKIRVMLKLILKNTN